MKNLLIVLFCLFISIAVFAQEEETLTNKSIIEMVELGFQSDVIISKINTSKCEFNTTIEILKELKNKNVPSDVLAAMVKADANSNIKAEVTGIFIVHPDSSQTKLLPTAFSATKTRTLAAGMTYGIASGKIKSVLNNATSKNILENGACHFKFCFAPFKDNQLNATDWWFRATTSPNEFVLVSLKVNKNKGTREIETGKANMWVGTNIGVDKGDTVEFDIIVNENTPGTFIVKTKRQLLPGEYCFFYQGTVPQGGFNNQSVFDFSVK